MERHHYYFVNAITMYRLLMAPVLIVLVMNGNLLLFKWLLAASFFTDAIDGALARRMGVRSIFGSRLDSVADDLNVAAACAGMVAFRPLFLQQQYVLIAVLVALFLIQLVLALIRYQRMTGFHTYLAKIAAVMQGVFFVTAFFLDSPSGQIFYIAAFLTIADLAEEILLVLLLKNWRNDVKGIYWLMRQSSAPHHVKV